MDRHLVVMGAMGVGKTTLARGLAAALGRPLRDSDLDIQALFGRTGREIAASAGVDELHDLEAAVLLGALAAPTPTVIAAAGWIVEVPWCREALGRRSIVVVLDLPVDDLVDRMDEGEHRRAMGRTEVIALAERRRPLFDEVADLRLDARRTPAELVDEVVAAIGRHDPA